MKHMYLLLVLVLGMAASCSSSDDGPIAPPNQTLYFPPIGSNTWETVTPSSLQWDESQLDPLKDFLIQANSKSFMILVNGRIVMEEYFDGHTAQEPWEWNSAGKTLASATTGIAQQNGLIDIDNKVSDYLGENWTNMDLEKENLITVRNLLTMTSGIDDTKQLVVKSNLTYVADAGTRWAYGNVFQKLMDVVAESSATDFESYFNTNLKAKIGMDGFWNEGTIFTIFHSTTRSMARFGLLSLNNGSWDGEQIIDASFFTECVTTSQSINPSYGYLWWLNGKSQYMVPSQQAVFPGTLIPNAPADMVAAMGAKDQRIYVVPSKNMVVIRMGNASDPQNTNFAVSGFDNALWEKINAVIN
ncbi:MULTISPECIES: serine hydrolase domain-containing protein [Maribacter]|uniref:Serine hydrolase n=1 Tax=Maribacter flavus TaxID=1658664 RepID=A0ABU7IIE2_9FLAO|nr:MULTISPECIES: serine hydrolase [Maribacter]MDC6405634.1 serine hydrolase [Maribacter sp. PR66]MEE1972598.1 serine hydrolase [Maribacter flavus]